MSPEQQVVIDIENAIANMTESDCANTHKAISNILALEAKFGIVPLHMAIALIGARLAAA